MKKILTSILVVFLGMVLFVPSHSVKAQSYEFHETFPHGNNSGSYSTIEFTGSTGVEWIAKGSRGDLGGYEIDGGGIMFRMSDGSIKGTIQGGISSLTIDLLMGFTGGNASDRGITVLIDDEVVGNYTLTSTSKETFEINELNFTGTVTLEIRANGNSTRQLTLNNLRWNSAASEITANITQIFDADNQTPLTIEAEYGNNIVVATSVDHDFAFWVVNGKVRKDLKETDNQFIMVNDLNITQVYKPEGQHAVLFMDSNGNMLGDAQFINDGGNVVAPDVTLLSKPGFTVSDTPWLSNDNETSLENITSSRVYTLQYELTNTEQYTVSVDGIETLHAYNEIVTVESELPGFTHWEDEDGNFVSSKSPYSFTVLNDKTLVAKTGLTEISNTVTMTNALNLSTGFNTFVSQVDLQDGYEIVEHGFIATKDETLRTTYITEEIEGVEKARVEVIQPKTLEYILSIDESYVAVRAYVVVRDNLGNIDTFYSDFQYPESFTVTFDTDGGSSVETLLLPEGSKVTKPEDPIKEGFKFIEWQLDGVTFDFETPVTKDFTLEAIWDLYTISEVISSENNTKVIFEGIVTGFTEYNSQYSNYDKVWIEDETGAITIYRGAFPETLSIGDKYIVTGSKTTYNGLNQIGSGATLELIDNGNELITATIVTDITTLTEEYQANRVNISGKVVSVNASGQELVVDVNGTNITVRSNSSTKTNVINAHLLTAIVGQTVNLIEIHVDWNFGPQLIPTLVSQVEFVEITDAEKLALAGNALFDELNNKEFNMGTNAELPTEGLHETTITWTSNPADAILEGNWMDVTEDTVVTLTATLTLGEETLDKDIEITIVFVDPSEPEKELVIVQQSDFGTTDGWGGYGSLTKDIDNGALNPTPTGTTSWKILGGNVNNADWDYIRMGGKVASSETNPQAYLATNFKFEDTINSIVINIVGLDSASGNETIHIQESIDGSNWTTVSSKEFASTGELEINDLSIQNGNYIRILFERASTSSNRGTDVKMVTFYSLK